MTATLTLADVEAMSDRQVYDWLDRSVSVPIHDGMQAQGDIIVVPISRTPGGGAVDCPRHGIDVVPSVNGGHAHTLLAPDGGCTVRLTRTTGPEDLVIALIDTTETCYLLHAEHGASGIAPGRYEIRRQREWSAAEARRIAD